MAEVGCPICHSPYGAKCEIIASGGFDGRIYQCDICGRFKLDGSAEQTYFSNPQKLSKIERAAITWRTRNAQCNPYPRVSIEFIENVVKSGQLLPSPSAQATNIIRYIGDIYSATGEIINAFPLEFHAIVGSITRSFALKIVNDLVLEKIISALSVSSYGDPGAFSGISLTLAGWERYESEKKGKMPSRTGFIALKFDQSDLDSFLISHIKPAVAELGYSLVDMRDQARAGLIDDLMRVQIRDSAFVLAELTHDSPGAYWEAGYAEGLGKPVLYICEKSKFKTVQTHFDTNHCTTVLWQESDPDSFRGELKATLRRSLGLFET